MKILVCNSKNWFQLTSEVCTSFRVTELVRKEDLTLEFVEKLQPNYIFFPHWNWVIPKEIHEQNECIVFHTAPLPYGRGGSPIQNLIIDGYTSSPVCAIKVTNELDAGPIYSSQVVSLEGDLTSIFLRVSKAINSLITDIINNKPMPMPQRGEPHKYMRLQQSANEIPKGMCLKELYDRVRMVDHPDYPKAYIMHGDLKLEFHNASFDGNSLEMTCKIKK